MGILTAIWGLCGVGFTFGLSHLLNKGIDKSLDNLGKNSPKSAKRIENDTYSSQSFKSFLRGLDSKDSKSFNEFMQKLDKR